MPSTVHRFSRRQAYRCHCLCRRTQGTGRSAGPEDARPDAGADMPLAVDVAEDAFSFVFTADVPGVQRSAVKVRSYTGFSGPLRGFSSAGFSLRPLPALACSGGSDMTRYGWIASSLMHR